MSFSFCVVIFAAFVGAFTVPKVYDIYHVSESVISLYTSVLKIYGAMSSSEFISKQQIL